MRQSKAERSWMLVLCYLALLGLIPFWAAREDREIRWHAVNGLFLFGAVVLFGALTTVVGLLVPSLSCLYGIVMFLVLVVYSVVVILAIVKALAGERLVVPGISLHADRI